MASVIYAVVNVNTDSYVGSDVIDSYHSTLDGAIKAIPERYLSRETEANNFETYDGKPRPHNQTRVKDYIYYAIDSLELKD